MSMWIGECCWCGVEVEIFDHTDCTADPSSPDFIGFVS